MNPEAAFDTYHEAVFRFLYRLTQRAEVAEDLTQECFLALIRRPESFDPARGDLRTYLFGIARNLALKHYRDHRPEVSLDEQEDSMDFRSAPGPELASAVEQAVAGLPALQREALILFEYEGFTLEEAARVTGADAGTIKSRLHRARARLKRVLAPFGKEGCKEGYGSAKTRPVVG